MTFKLSDFCFGFWLLKIPQVFVPHFIKLHKQADFSFLCVYALMFSELISDAIFDKVTPQEHGVRLEGGTFGKTHGEASANRWSEAESNVLTASFRTGLAGECHCFCLSWCYKSKGFLSLLLQIVLM